MPTLELADGRTLSYEEAGAREGTPVLFQHGTGDSRLARHPDDSVTSSLGLRLVTADRPGVGGSSPRKDRSIVDWVGDVEQLADALGIAEFAVAGHSGGGPHALAIAHRLGDRVSKVALASPLAPFDEPGTRGMVKDKDLRTIFRFAHVKFLAGAMGKLEARHYSKDIHGFVAHCAEAWPADRDVFTDPVLEPMFEAEFTAALVQGGVGALDDMWAFLDWGFPVEEVAQPVEVFYGDADDILDPAMAERLTARLPNCRAHAWAGAGHYAVFARWEEFLRSVT